jgi:aspartate-semialdehyde dehydrogenase
LGADIINSLGAYNLPNIHVLAVTHNPAALKGETVAFGPEGDLTLQAAANVAWGKVNVVIHAGAARDAASIYKQIAPHGGTLIDLTDTFALDPDTFMAVSAKEGVKLPEKMGKNVVSIPHSAVCLLAPALAALHDAGKLTRANITAMLAVNHMGRAGMDELFNHTKNLFMTGRPEADVFPQPIAFNILPTVGAEREDGFTETEWSMIVQLKKAVHSKARFLVQAVQVPVFVGDSFMVQAQFEDSMTAIKALTYLSQIPGLGVVEDSLNYPTPAEVTGEDWAFVARLRDDFTADNSLCFWLTGDHQRAQIRHTMLALAAILKLELPELVREEDDGVSEADMAEVEPM